ncbi:CoxG family protein [Ornithinibacillus halophilus]|uniref:Carbon monoxide dehydrogenase subunit G n=1 Tax=Ornithinibacillus halophilus TaxID=930117 RepID=A0A1M5J5V4_9BACI|nr:SRPBCC family protein [Ornithinibacillus halophilus]SHG35600.1 Carbon monoxide dehydrogenase subunit G [Ornithinibacillus halophilus]
MPRGTYQVELNIPIHQIWDFISDSKNWAPLVPGYQKHEEHSYRESTWTLKGDIGVLQKTVKMKVNITEWQEPTKVSFILTGLNEKFNGKGTFEAQALPNSHTKMTSNLEIAAKGMKGSIVNPVLKTVIPKQTKELTERIIAKIKERRYVRQVD